MTIAVDDIDLSDPDFWALPEDAREEAFATLRRERPVSFHEEREFEMVPKGPGYWALTRYDDIWHASRHPDVFISGRGTSITDAPPFLSELLGSMINMDAPRHHKLRGLVNRGFTPRQVGQLGEDVRTLAREIVDDVAPLGECDFVRDIAAALPLRIICDMLGIPRELHERIFDLTNTLLGIGDPELVSTVEQFVGAAMELWQLALEQGERGLREPSEDLTSQLMHAEVEGERLTAQEFASFFVLLAAAGNETTRNAISHGMKALTDHPAQREIWQSDFEAVAPTAVEEIVRWATPVIQFRRTAAVDTEIGGQPIAAGEKVVLFYSSANRDETKFADPYRFDVLRTPNEHVGYGAGGPHFCLGAHLARREITVMFDELFKRLPDIEISGPAEMLQSNFIHGIKRMPCRFTPA